VSLLASFRSNRFLPALLTAALTVPLFPRPARADSTGVPTPAGPSSGYDASLDVPETGSAVSDGAQQPVSVNPATGTATVAVSFEIPRARGAAQPHLGLTYSSSAGKGLGGYGWSFAVPSITRAPLSGPPLYNEPYGENTTGSLLAGDRFSFDGAALVPICAITDGKGCAGDGTLQLPAAVTTSWAYFRLEEGAGDTRLFWSPDHLTWLVQYKDGTTLELGKPLVASTSSWFGPAIDEDILPTSLIPAPYRWNVVRQYDAERSSGGVPVNPIVYQWNTIAGDTLLYLTDIFYTPATSASGTAPSDPTVFADHVHFAYDTSYYKAPIASFVPPVWRAAPNFLLSHADATAPISSASSVATPIARRLARRYWLNHAKDIDYFASMRVLLSQVQIEGRCLGSNLDYEQADFTVSATSGCPMLEPTTYTYKPVLDDMTVHPMSPALNMINQDGAPYLYDVNSDGIPDVVYFNEISTSAYEGASVYLTSPAGPFSAIQSMPFTYPSNFDPEANTGGTPTELYPGDFIADGRQNMLIAAGESPYGPGLSFATMTPIAPVAPSSSFLLSGQGTLSVPLSLPSSLSFGNAPGSWYIAQEQPLAVVDFDGDGYPDLMTDAPASQLGTVEQGLLPPAYHSLVMRSSRVSADGSVSPFSYLTPGVSPSTLGTSPPESLYPSTAESNASFPVTNLPIGQLFGEGASVQYPPLWMFADMNGDGLVDWVTMPNAGGALTYWVGHGDGSFGSCADGSNACIGNARFKGADAGTAFLRAPSLINGSSVFAHDVTGDGFDDLIVTSGAGITVYTNLQGTELDLGATVNLSALPLEWHGGQQILFGDMDGSGVDDVVVLQGGPDATISVSYIDVSSARRPGLLTSVQNGYGATTTIDYRSFIM
jgi:hypothetical protein